MPEITLNIGYKEIQIISFDLHIPKNLKIKTEEKDLFSFTYNLNSRIELKKELFVVNLEIITLYGKDHKSICSLNTAFEYSVIGLEKIIKKEGDKITVPDQLPATLIANAVSTSRGILFMKTMGTPLENVYLPIVNANSFSNVKLDKPELKK